MFAKNCGSLAVRFALILGLLSGMLAAVPVKSGLAPTITASQSSGQVRFAVIGDYGKAGQEELDVANLVKSWNPDFITTTGDNNYPDGTAQTIDANIGQYYHEFI